MSDTPEVRNALPEVGGLYVHKAAGDVTVTGLVNVGRGRPRRDGSQGGTVVFSDIDGIERRARLRDWQRMVSAA